MISIRDALDSIRETWPSNVDCLDDLKDSLSGAQPIPLVPFVGAGLSMPMGFPSWTGFLRKLAAECGATDEVEKLLEAERYEEAAESIEQALTPTLFHKRVSNTFGQRKSHACELKGAILALTELAAGAVVTTNFDRLLERVFLEAGAPFEHVVWGSQVDSMRRAVAENKPYLLKIHGDAEERTDRVLTRREFEKHYAPGDPEGLRAQLGRVFQGRTLLFVGCSLGVDRTMAVLSEVLQQGAGLQHYAIVERPAADQDLFAKQRSLGGRGIVPIWYPAGKHDLIEPLLRWIGSLKPSGRIPGPELVLERPAQRKHQVRSELDLLVAYQRTVALKGRDAEMQSLRNWLRIPADVSVRVITGGGGSGKTRLAVEVIEWLESAEPGQWQCGFLTQAEIERFSGLQNLSQWRRRKPVLAVVDYAAGSAASLRTWLEQLAAAKDGGEKLRLLLLEREASVSEGWLASAISRGHAVSAVRALFDPPDPVRLQAIAETTGRREVLRATVNAGAALLGVDPPPVPDADADEWFDSRIQEPKWGDPLVLMMAALSTLETGLAGALSLNRTDLAYRLAERERARIELFGRGAPAGLMQHMAAYVTASGGLSREELRSASKAESEVIGRHHPGGWGVLADCVHEALRAGDGAQAVEPDVVGEALLLQVWGGEKVQEGNSALVRAVKTRGRNVAAFVIRTAQDFCVGATPRPEPLQWLDALIKVAIHDVPFLRVMEVQIPLQTVALRERAAEIDTALAGAMDGATDTAAQLERARALNNLGVRLSGLGRREEALQATEEALQIHRRLTAAFPGIFLADLAMSLNNLGLRLNELGRPGVALPPSEEAAEIRLQLAAERPDTSLPDLASSLNNVGVVLNSLGRHEEALQATMKAVEIRRGLVARRPDLFVADLASSLNNLANNLSRLGRRQETVRVNEEAVEKYEQLAAERPDAFLPDLAVSLNNLGTFLHEDGKSEESVPIIERAIKIRRQLAKDRPDAFLSQLASSLTNYGMSLSALGRREEALQATEEAAGYYRELVARGFDVFLPNFAISLNNAAVRQVEIGNVEEALRSTAEAVEICRQMAVKNPQAFIPDLARSLGTQGVALMSSGNHAAAVDSAREAIQHLKPLFLGSPEAFRRLMTSLVQFYAAVCSAAAVERDPALLSEILPLLTTNPS